MTAVKIRHENDPDAKYLADVPFDQLDTVIPVIKGWGLDGEEEDLSGQFVYGDLGAYFEVIIHAIEDEATR